AANSPDDEVAGSARVFLGLLARARGDAAAAQKLLAAAAASRSAMLSTAARRLLEPDAPARASFAFVLAPGVDSNVALLPATSMPGVTGPASDGYLVLVGAATARPLPGVGLLLEDSASYRQYARWFDYDFFA